MAGEKFRIVQSSCGLISIYLVCKYGLIYVNTSHFLFSSVWLHFVIALTLREYNIRSLLRFYSKNLNYIAAVSRLYVIFKLYLKRIDLVIFRNMYTFESKQINTFQSELIRIKYIRKTILRGVDRNFITFAPSADITLWQVFLIKRGLPYLVHVYVLVRCILNNLPKFLQ